MDEFTNEFTNIVFGRTPAVHETSVPEIPAGAPIIPGQEGTPTTKPKYDNETRALLNLMSAPHLRS